MFIDISLLDFVPTSAEEIIQFANIGYVKSNPTKPLSEPAPICTQDDCDKIAHYSNETEKRCYSHKTEDMINFNICIEADCTVRPTYNYPGEIAGIYCKKHSLKGMKNVIYKPRGRTTRKNKKPKPATDIQPVIDIQPTTDISNVGDSVEKVNDTNITNITKDKYTCEYENCKQKKTYGELFDRYTMCKIHKLEHHVKTINPKCMCGEKAFVGYSYPEFCISCAPVGVLDADPIECSLCNIPYVQLTDNLCELCYLYRNPNKKIQHPKEEKIKMLLDRNNVSYRRDSLIPGSKIRKRSDFLIERGSYYVIIEVDENQHKKSYVNWKNMTPKRMQQFLYARDNVLENDKQRMIDIQNDDEIPIVFIRFNPDAYSKKGKMVYSYTGRENMLLDLLNSITEPTEPLTVHYLFYDNK
jgi:hypothetical protein